MTSDDEKANYGAMPERDNGREWHINYWNCWHCKTCEAELVRKCGCGKLFDLHSFEEWMDCSDEKTSQICPRGCVDVGGWKEFGGTVDVK